MPFVQIIIAVAFTILGQLLAPKPKAASLDQLQFPTATEDRPKPMWVGTVRHKSPNCIWYGDYSVKALHASGLIAALLGGLFGFLLNPTTGFAYRIGFQLDLGWGQLDEITKITITGGDNSEKEAWSGSVSSGTLTIDKPELFGGHTIGGNGGFQALVTVYPGDPSQIADPYVVSKAGATPTYRKDVLLVFQGLTTGGAYIGNSPNVPTISVDARRCPNQLGVTGGKHVINSHDANPVCALYEFMTREYNEFGGGYSPSQFNIDNWITAAETLHSEGLGISRMFDSAGDVGTIINEYEQFMDAVVNINLTTGLFEIVLVRDDYDPDDIPVIGDDDVIEVVSYKRGSWSETYNEVKLTYIDRDQNYEELPLALQDAASASGQAEVRSQTVAFPGLSNAANANFVLSRSLKLVSTPLTTLGLKINRKNYDLQGGSVFKWVGTKYGIAGMIFRVATLDSGALNSNVIELKAAQDIFALGSAAYLPNTSGWVEPNTDPANITVERAFEQPYAFHGTDNTRIATLAKPANGAQSAYIIYSREDALPYEQRASDQPFTPTGLLESPYSSTPYNTLSELRVTPDWGMEDLPDSITPATITAGAGGLIIIGDEILAYESYTVVSGVYVFNGVWGGLLDTVLEDHAIDDRVWFIAEGVGLDPTNFTALSTVSVKLASSTISGSVPEGSCTEITV